jgi:hypothetical protein
MLLLFFSLSEDHETTLVLPATGHRDKFFTATHVRFDLTK